MRQATRAFLFLLIILTAACGSALDPPGPVAPGGGEASAEAIPPPGAKPTPAVPGPFWGIFLQSACLWSSAAEGGTCFGKREPGFRVEVLRIAGDRLLVRDSLGEAYVDRDAVQVDPAALARLEQVPVHQTLALCLPAPDAFRRRRAAELLQAGADWLERQVRPGQPGATVYVQTGYSDQSALLVLTVPPVSAEPPPPLLTPTLAQATATALPGFNVYANARVRASEATIAREKAEAVVRANQSVLTSYATSRERVQQELSSARRAVREHVGQLRALADRSWKAEDVQPAGCVRRAAERLQGAAGRKRLIVMLDLDRAGPSPDLPSDALRNTRVVVIAACSRPEACAHAREAWRAAIHASAPSSIRVADPAEPADRAFD